MLPPVRRAARAAACAGLALVAATNVGAQTPQPAAHHTSRGRWLFGAIGAGLGVGLSSLARGGNGLTGACSSGTCITAVSASAGGLLGFLIGAERDDLHALRYEGGVPLSPRLTSAALRGDVASLAVGDTLLVAGGSAGAELFRTRDLRPLGARGATLRGVGAVAVGPASVVTIGTGGGAYLYPGARAGALVLEQPVQAAEAGPARIYLGTGNSVVSVPAAADSVGAWPATDAGAPVRALAYDDASHLLWAGTDAGVVAFAVRGDSLARVGALTAAAPVRRISVQGGRLAAALGDSGVQLFDVTTPAAPRAGARWRSGHFAYDVSLAGGRLFVASGLQGVHVLDAGSPSLRLLGLARDPGFSVALASRGGYTYVLDRSHNVLHRFDSTFPTP